MQTNVNNGPKMEWCKVKMCVAHDRKTVSKNRHFLLPDLKQHAEEKQRKGNNNKIKFDSQIR